MFKKKPIVSNDVCSYTVLAVCVWLYEGKRYSPLAIKKNATMIEEEYTICLPSPTEKRYSPLMCRKKERIVGYDSSWFKVYMYVVKGQKCIHVKEFQ